MFLASLFSIAVAHAYNAYPSSYTWYPNAAIPKASPIWIQNTTAQQPNSYLATETFSYTPQSETKGLDLAVTVYFNENVGSFLRVYWHSPYSVRALSENLFEGISMPNQRILLIPYEELSNFGDIIFQSGEKEHSLIKVKFQWLRPQVVSIPKKFDRTALIDSEGQTYTKYESEGHAPLEIEDEYWADIVRAPLISLPERIEDIVEFVFELEEIPNIARLEAQFAGLPLLGKADVWLNDTNLGSLNLRVPSLSDEGYNWNDQLEYVGWREGAMLIHPAMLVEGTNRVIIDWNNPDFPRDATPVAVRDLVLELSYAEPPELKFREPSGAMIRPTEILSPDYNSE